MKYCDLLDWIRAKWLRIDQSARSYEEIRGAIDCNGGRRPQRDPPQRRWTATVRHLVCRNVWRVRLDGGHRDGDWHRNSSLVVGVVWRQKSTKLWALSRLQSHICTLAKLILVKFLVTDPASFCYSWIYWRFERSNTYYRKYWKAIRLFCLCFVEGYTPSHLPWITADYGINN